MGWKEFIFIHVYSNVHERCGNLMINIIPVSYTHLDVYKRQENIIFAMVKTFNVGFLFSDIFMYFYSNTYMRVHSDA